MLKKIEAALVALNNQVVSRLGAALFIPALTALGDKDLAKQFLHQFFPHLPDVDITLGAVMLGGFAGFLLYQGKPEKTEIK